VHRANLLACMATMVKFVFDFWHSTAIRRFKLMYTYTDMIHAGKPVMSLDRLPATSNPMASPHTASLWKLLIQWLRHTLPRYEAKRKAIPKQSSKEKQFQNNAAAQLFTQMRSAKCNAAFPSSAHFSA
jgi:hypothetical protein